MKDKLEKVVEELIRLTTEAASNESDEFEDVTKYNLDLDELSKTKGRVETMSIVLIHKLFEQKSGTKFYINAKRLISIFEHDLLVFLYRLLVDKKDSDKCKSSYLEATNSVLDEFIEDFKNNFSGKRKK